VSKKTKNDKVVFEISKSASAVLIAQKMDKPQNKQYIK
jgi:hypothetical protein